MKITRGLVLGLDSMLQHIIDAESSSFGMLQFCPNTHTCKSNTPWSQYLCAPNKIFGGVAVPSITCMGIQHQRVCTLCAPNAESLGVLKFRPACAGFAKHSLHSLIPLDIFSNQYDIYLYISISIYIKKYKVENVVHRKWSDGHYNWSDTRLSVVLLEYYSISNQPACSLSHLEHTRTHTCTHTHTTYT